MADKSWHLDRRSFLYGSGVACALPFLEGMGRAAARSRRPAPRRLCFVYFPNGASFAPEKSAKWSQWRWFPLGQGADYRFTKVLESLAPYREKLSFLGGLSHPKSRQLLGHLAGDTWLTGGDVRGDQYRNTVSVDQVAAHELKRHTRYPSLVLSTDGGVGYKSRVSTLSFDFNGRPIPSENRQRSIFERYFAPKGGATSADRRAHLARGKRIVDLVLEDSRRLSRVLGAHDKRKLDEYLSSLESIEEQIERNESWLDVPIQPFDTDKLVFDADPKKDPTAYLGATYGLIALAFQLDLTRVVTYMTGREDGMGFADHFPRLACGIKRGHHTISHDKHEGHWEQWGRYDRWHGQQFARFVATMDSLEDEHGKVLDRTAVLYGSCCSTTHNARNYPLALVGGSALGIRHGRYHKYDEKTPFSNALLTMLRAAGVEKTSFADSTGTLEALGV